MYVGRFSPECSETLMLTSDIEFVDIEPDEENINKPGNTCQWNILVSIL